MCICQQITSTAYEQRLAVLENVRNQCPALKLVLIPDKIWDQFKRFETGTRDEALHIPETVNALLDGRLHKLTRPIHKYVLDGDKLRGNLKKQYLNELQQNWMFEKETPLDRHELARMHRGRIVELQIANWFEEMGWSITGLEATGAETDIECVRPVELKSAVEVKYIGQRDKEFEQLVNAIQGRRQECSGGGNDACNYVLFRAYEAAKQLEETEYRRIAVIVIDSLTYAFLKIPLKNGFINWERPSFLEASYDWQKFLAEKKSEKRFSTIETDLAPTIKTLHELWLVVMGDDYVYHLCGHYVFTGNGITKATVN